MGSHPVEHGVAEADLTRRGAVDPRQDVEHRRLAGAVGADDGVHRPRCTVKDTSVSALMAPNSTVTLVTSRVSTSARRSTAGVASLGPPRQLLGRVSGPGRVRSADRLRRGRGRGAARHRTARAPRPNPRATRCRRRGRTRCRRRGAPSSRSAPRAGPSALTVDFPDDLTDLPDDARGEAKGGLVQQEQARPRHQATADGEHLLLAAGEEAGALRAALGQDREHVVDPLVVSRAPAAPRTASHRPAGSPPP